MHNGLLGSAFGCCCTSVQCTVYSVVMTTLWLYLLFARSAGKDRRRLSGLTFSIPALLGLGRNVKCTIGRILGGFISSLPAKAKLFQKIQTNIRTAGIPITTSYSLLAISFASAAGEDEIRLFIIHFILHYSFIYGWQFSQGS